MRHGSLTTAALTFGLALTLGGAFAQAPPPAPDTTQPAPEPAPNAPNYGFQYNGLVDGYYQFQFNNPKKASVLPGDRAFDVRHNTPVLSLAELNVFKVAPPHGLGFKSTLAVGDTVDIVHSGIVGPPDAGEARFKNVLQLYGTYAFGTNGSGVDVGKFVTPFGYEVIESNANYNYSRSIPFLYAIPFYHFGARLYVPVPGVKGLTGTIFLVRAIFNTPTAGVQDDNKKPGYIGQLSFADPRGAFTVLSTLGLGKDKFGGTDTKVVLSDSNFIYNFTPKILAGLDYGYGRNTPDGGRKVITNSYAVYYRQTLKPTAALALRFSGLSQKTSGNASVDSRPYEVTATYEIKPATNFLTRFEYRHDRVNSGNGLGIAFADKDSNPAKNSQDTLTVSGIFTF